MEKLLSLSEDSIEFPLENSCKNYMDKAQIESIKAKYGIVLKHYRGHGKIDNPIIVEKLRGMDNREFFIVEYIKWLNLSHLQLLKVSLDDFFSSAEDQMITANYHAYHFCNDQFKFEKRTVYFKFV